MSTLALPTLPSPLPTSTNLSTRRRSSLALPTKVGAGSPSPDLDEDDDAEEDDEEEGAKKRVKKKKGGTGGGGGGEVKGEHKYMSEISQMMFVFGEVQDPLPETVRMVEDVVRGQIIEIVTRARLLTHLRSSRFLSAEDLIFLIRGDRGKVNRLRTYLSWKDVRKRAKEDEEGGDVDVEEAAAPKGRKTMPKLPWELLTPFSDFVRGLPLPSKNRVGVVEDEDEEDEDEMQAYQDSMQRLRDADEITKKMTKDEYVHYSDCRQASFTYRKARRFRDFVNFSAYLDVRPNDDIVDILGFLSFEMVRSLCVTALEVRQRLERTAPTPPVPPTPTRRPTNANANLNTGKVSPVKRRLTQDSPLKKAKSDIVASPEAITPATATTMDHRKHVTTGAASGPHHPVSLFAPPPSARSPLLPSHVLEAFAQIQRQQGSTRIGGMRNFRGGINRCRVALV